ncbi:metal-dependent hydrolase [Parasphingorhabdus cellanae]|uniref:Metal-dependent hydrolase n=1 Tax=Parasphingorhabdus cellanae TaxID=2806553 RepID=A0ABX7T292_9SPHN|nr:metal-dependent hydrolase [Parasphingorhabdus cellanae]QTD55688.1 metal-dependent hydrolase [Parasphingorhabdus cellanae]
MPTIMSHAAVPIAGALLLGRSRLSVPVIAMGIVFAMLPDADVIGFGLGVDYADSWGHRGATHSLVFAAVAALLTVALIRPQRYIIAGLFLFVAMASHGLLDTLTNGGLGAALFWPWDDARHFAPLTPIAVSPIGISDFISARGMKVLQSEAIWIWTPLAVLVGAVLGLKQWRMRWLRQNGMVQ